jgi:putative addiction module component (TIGR02574 family)
MSNGFSEIEREAQKLSAAERERLAQRLFESVHRKELTEVDEVWLAVAEERFSDYRSGGDQGIGEEEFFRRVQRDLGWT